MSTKNLCSVPRNNSSVTLVCHELRSPKGHFCSMSATAYPTRPGDVRGFVKTAGGLDKNFSLAGDHGIRRCCPWFDPPLGFFASRFMQPHPFLAHRKSWIMQALSRVSLQIFPSCAVALHPSRLIATRTASLAASTTSLKQSKWIENAAPRCKVPFRPTLLKLHFVRKFADNSW